MLKFKTLMFVIALLLSVLVFMLSFTIKANDYENYDVVYFGSYTCSVCQELEQSGVLDDLVLQGYRLKKYMSEDDYQLFETMFVRYARTYEVPRHMNLVPILYVGDTYFLGLTDIKNAINQNTVQNIISEKDLLPLVDLIYEDLTMSDLLTLITSTLLLGFLDAFNPCALAMLIMFLSFLTDKKLTKAIALICAFYIIGVFITYFLLGTILMSVLSIIQPYMFIFYIIIIVLALFIAYLNLIDYLSIRKKDYGAIKNQLPKRIFTVTKKMMSNFSEKIEQENPSVYLLAFLIGVFVAVVEFPCSGQAFVAWTAIVVDRTSHQMIFFILLFFYVLLFVSPLVIISLFGLRTQNVPVISNFVRTKLDVIKLINAIVFLLVAIYYIFKIF